MVVIGVESPTAPDTARGEMTLIDKSVEFGERLGVKMRRAARKTPNRTNYETLALFFGLHYRQGLHFVRFPNVLSSTQERRLINEDLT